MHSEKFPCFLICYRKGRVESFQQNIFTKLCIYQIFCKFIGSDGITLKRTQHKEGRNYVLFDESVAKCTRVDIHEITKLDIDRK